MGWCAPARQAYPLAGYHAGMPVLGVIGSFEYALFGLAFVVLAAAAVCLVFWIGWRAIGKVGTVLAALERNLALDRTASVQGLLVSGLLFHEGLTSSLRGITNFVFRLPGAVAAHFGEAWSSMQCQPDRPSGGLGECFVELSFRVLSTPGRLAAAARESDELPLTQLVLFVVWAALLAKILSLFRPATAPADAAAEDESTSNRLLFIALSAGAYLVIAAVVALPLIDPGDAVDKAQTLEFEERLNKQLLAEDAFEKEFPATLPVKEQAERAVDTTELQQGWATFRSISREHRRWLFDAANRYFEMTNDVRQAPHKRSAYLSLLQAWHAQSQALVQISMSNCKASYEEALRRAVSGQSEVLTPLCKEPTVLKMEPPVATIELGAFRLVAGWLVRTDSKPLTLITGLLGCGLLGSVVSTLLARRMLSKSAAAHPPLPHLELAGVLIRGVTAALVVFLAAKGGLAMISSNGEEPNSHILLLLCLLSAVYSEQVWSWAESKFPSFLPAGSADQAARTGGRLPVPAPAPEPPLRKEPPEADSPPKNEASDSDLPYVPPT
jgi:hypothetical protein